MKRASYREGVNLLGPLKSQKPLQPQGVIMEEGYYIEDVGDGWQSVFPSDEADLSQLHVDVADALEYMTQECGIPRERITILNPNQE
jgi:hypothetical protein